MSTMKHRMWTNHLPPQAYIDQSHAIGSNPNLRHLAAITEPQRLSLLLVLEVFTPALYPRQVPARDCHCISLFDPHSNFCPSLSFYEAVVLLNNLDQIVSLPLQQKRQLVSWCLDICCLDYQDSPPGTGSGWRLTTTRPTCLSAIIWAQCTNLYHLCLVHGSSTTEMCMQITHRMHTDSLAIPMPHDPALRYRHAATESKLRRPAPRPSDSVYDRFGNFVWSLVYQDDLGDVLACRECEVIRMGRELPTSYAEQGSPQEQAKFGLSLLRKFVAAAAGNDEQQTITATGRDGVKVQLTMQAEVGKGPKVFVATPATAARKKKVSVARRDVIGVIASVAVKHAESTAQAVGCVPMPAFAPKLPDRNSTPAWKTGDMAVKRAERLELQLKAWLKHCQEENRTLETEMCCDCIRPSCGGLGELHANTGEVTMLCPVHARLQLNSTVGRMSRRELRNGIKNVEAQRRLLAKRAMEAAKNIGEAEANSFLEALERPEFFSEELLSQLDL